MTRARGDFLNWASGRIEEARQAERDEACGYRRECIHQMRQDSAAVTKPPEAHRSQEMPRNSRDVAAGMMGGMGGS